MKGKVTWLVASHLVVLSLVLASCTPAGGQEKVTLKKEVTSKEKVVAPDKAKLSSRVAVILGIEQQKVKDAFTQARIEMRKDARDKRLQRLVNKGKITEEEATQYKEWLQAKPDISVRSGLRAHGGSRGHGGLCVGKTKVRVK